jgi:hypothetical protein
VPGYARPVIGRAGVTKACGQLATALRAGDDAVARSLAERSGIPQALLTEWEFGPCGTVDVDAVALALSCIAALADGGPPASAWLSNPEVIGLVADVVELAATGEDEHQWLRGIRALDPAGCLGVPELLQARAAEGCGRSDEARLLIGSCLTAAPGLVPAVRDAMEYELCAGNWARAFELASSLGDDGIATPLLRTLGQLREPVHGAERAGRNQSCPCGSGRKYKACCRVKDLEGGTHPLPLRAPALYATIDVASTRGAWDRLTSPCLPAPEPPVRDLADYDAYVAELPPRFWVRNSDTEIEYVGQVDANRLTNFGTVRRTRRGFVLTANSVRRAADLTAMVLDAAAAAGQVGKVTGQSAKTAEEMIGDGSKADDAPDSREAMCRRLGVEVALTSVPPRTLILEQHFLPVDSSVGEGVVREINRELSVRSMLDAKNYDGRTPAEAVAAGGAARERVLAMIDDCEWRMARAEAEGDDRSFMPLPADLRRRAGLRLPG